MDPTQNPNSNQYYYPQQNMLYNNDLYLDSSSSSQIPHSSHNQHLYHHQQQQQHHHQQQDSQYAYQRYPRPHMQQHMQPQPPQRSHTHPPTYQHHIPSPMQHQQPYDNVRHAHSQPSIPRVSSVNQQYPTYDHPVLPARSARTPSEASTSYHADQLGTLRDDMHMHVSSTSLAHVAGGPSGDIYSSATVPRLPPILQVEKQQVTTSATQTASANRRRNEANFRCPVPGCGSTFTRRFNLKGHLRSHTSERPFACEWPGCDKAFARQHDCKRHYQLHSAKAGTHMCQGCGKSFSRTDALNRHLRSEGGVDCREQHQAATSSRDYLSMSSREDSESPSDTTDGTTSGTPSHSRPPSV